LNPYVYAAGRPLAMSDPTGLRPDFDTPAQADEWFNTMNGRATQRASGTLPPIRSRNFWDYDNDLMSGRYRDVRQVAQFFNLDPAILLTVLHKEQQGKSPWLFEAICMAAHLDGTPCDVETAGPTNISFDLFSTVWAEHQEELMEFLPQSRLMPDVDAASSLWINLDDSNMNRFALAMTAIILQERIDLYSDMSGLAAGSPRSVSSVEWAIASWRFQPSTIDVVRSNASIFASSPNVQAELTEIRSTYWGFTAAACRVACDLTIPRFGDVA